MTALYVLLGIVFGFVLSRSGAADYNYIQSMLLLESFQLYGIMGTAVALIAPGLWLLSRHGRTVLGHRLMFGVGWSMAGMCPGPILVNIGEGKIYALAALAGSLVGAGAFGSFYESLRAPFRLPPLQVGTGEG
jgi:uncharacterized membrane protein YedE/YeeE